MSLFSRLTRTWRTVAPLRLSQLAFRLWYRVAPVPAGSPRVARGLEPAAVIPRAPLWEPIPTVEWDDATLRLTVCGKATTHSLTEFAWPETPGADDRLWAYTWHYHTWLLPLAEAIRVDSPGATKAKMWLVKALRDWLAVAVPPQPAYRSVAWNAYTVATRIEVWAQLLTEPTNAAFFRDEHLAESLWDALAWQASHLHARIEWDLRGNHLLRDAVGLAWAGRLFTGKPAERWSRTAGRIARLVAKEQILADGGHYERSPMYHWQVMGDLLTLHELTTDANLRQALRDCLAAMRRAATAMQHPDGRLVLFNDANHTGVPDREALGSAMDRAGIPAPTQPGDVSAMQHLPETGLLVACCGPAFTVMDVGAVGPWEQPGHAHADTLTVEVSWNNHALIVDPGVVAYNHDERRAYDRSTAAHNTVGMDGIDSSEVWHVFRVGRRAWIGDITLGEQNGHLLATAWHDGYRHLPGKPRHLRVLEMSPKTPLTIEDRLTGKGAHRATGGFLLAPGITAAVSPMGWFVEGPMGRIGVKILPTPLVQWSVGEAPFHPRWGEEITVSRLQWAYDGELPLTVRTEWEAINQ